MSACYFLTTAQLDTVSQTRPDVRSMDIIPFSFEDTGVLLTGEMMQELSLSTANCAATELQGIFRVITLDPVGHDLDPVEYNDLDPAEAAPDAEDAAIDEAIVDAVEALAEIAPTPAAYDRDAVLAAMTGIFPVGGQAPVAIPEVVAEVIAPVPVVEDPAAPLLLALAEPLAPLLARFGTATVVLSAPGPRTEGTGLRLVLGVAGIENTRERLYSSGFSDRVPTGLRRRVSYLYAPSYQGQSLLPVGETAQNTFPIGEMFRTQDGGVDILLPVVPGVLSLEATDGDISWYKEVLLSAEAELAEADRVRPETRDERFAGQLTAFVGFARAQMQVNKDSVVRTIMQAEDQIGSSQIEYLRHTRNLAVVRNQLAFTTARETEARTKIEQGIARIEAAPQVFKVVVGDTSIIVHTRDITAHDVHTGNTVALCAYKISFLFDQGCVHYEPIQNRGVTTRHPKLSGVQRSASRISLAVAESLTQYDLSSAWRQAIRFLETID